MSLASFKGLDQSRLYFLVADALSQEQQAQAAQGVWSAIASQLNETHIVARLVGILFTFD